MPPKKDDKKKAAPSKSGGGGGKAKKKVPPLPRAPLSACRPDHRAARMVAGRGNMWSFRRRLQQYSVVSFAPDGRVKDGISPVFGVMAWTQFHSQPVGCLSSQSAGGLTHFGVGVAVCWLEQGRQQPESSATSCGRAS